MTKQDRTNTGTKGHRLKGKVWEISWKELEFVVIAGNTSCSRILFVNGKCFRPKDFYGRKIFDRCEVNGQTYYIECRFFKRRDWSEEQSILIGTSNRNLIEKALSFIEQAMFSEKTEFRLIIDDRHIYDSMFGNCAALQKANEDLQKYQHRSSEDIDVYGDTVKKLWIAAIAAFLLLSFILAYIKLHE
ncbi:hypothetical protein ACFL6U_10270 [Planctomycetota bacterium]